MPLTMLVRPAVALLRGAVRRFMSTPPTAGPQSLTIGALTVNDNVHEIRPVPGVPTTRRSLGYEALLGIAQDLLLARFALIRALDKLTTEQLLEVLDEVDETAELHRPPLRRPKTTLRDENS